MHLQVLYIYYPRTHCHCLDLPELFFFLFFLYSFFSCWEKRHRRRRKIVFCLPGCASKSPFKGSALLCLARRNSSQLDKNRIELHTCVCVCVCSCVCLCTMCVCTHSHFLCLCFTRNPRGFYATYFPSFPLYPVRLVVPPLPHVVAVVTS